MKRFNPTLKNKIRLYLTSIGEVLHDFVYSPYFFSVIFFVMLMVMSLIADLERSRSRDLQDQLTIQQSHTERWKMEAERNLTIIENLAIENKENQRKLEEIKSILYLND